MSGAAVLHVQKVAGISGSEAHLLSLLPELRERGWDARMLMLHRREPGAWKFADALQSKGVPVDAISILADVDPVALSRLTVYVARRRPAILHTHLVHADVYGLTAGALARVPARISTKHGFNEFREHRLFALADRGVARLAHLQIAISRGLARYLAETEGFEEESFTIVHYGIAPGPDPPPYAGGGPRLLCVGRLIAIKGHAVLLEAFAEAKRTVPELTLRLAGTGPLETELRALAGELGVEGSVEFLGHVSPVAPAIEAAAIVIVPSLGEGFGMVALEAMERGRPVIASKVGGLGELIEHGRTGLLVPPGEAEPLARAIAELGGDLPRAALMGGAGRRRALEHFSDRRCADRIEELYRACLDTAGWSDGAGGRSDST